MALKTRKTPTTRKRAGTGTTARGQGSKTSMGRGRKAGAGNTAMGSNAITPETIKTYQQWLRFGQKNELLNRLFGSSHGQELFNNHQQNQQNQQSQPAKITAGTRRTAQERQAASA